MAAPHPGTTVLVTNAASGLGQLGRLDERFEIGAPIGVGGMGEVCGARDREIAREVAVKRLSSHSTSGQRRLLIEEARLQGRLDHPAIPPVYDVGLDEAGQLGFAMRRVTGTTLATLMAARDPAADGAGRATERLLRVFVEVCRAIDHAHARGVVHCDLKPSNVMVDDDDRVYVIDWGVATTFDDPSAPQRRAGGTLGYMPPEQLDAHVRLDGRTDIFALGAILFELLAGDPLYPRGEGLLDAALVGAADPRPARRAPDAEVPAMLDELCARALARAPDRRPARASELADQVSAWLDRVRDRAAQIARQRAHLARAQRDAADPATRARALGEAGRALALAPDDPEAVALVRTLLDSDDVPREAARELAEIADGDDRRLATAAAWSYLGFVLFPLTLLLQRHAAAWVLIASVGGWLGLEALALAARRGRGPRAWPWWSLGLLALQVLLFSRYLGPFVSAPAISALACAGMLMHPRVERVAPVIAILAAPLVVTVALEASGVWPATLTIGADTLTFASVVSDVRPTWTLAMLAFTALAIQLVGAAIGILVAAPAHRARRLRAAQAWHLAQLVPARRPPEQP
ncbi:MAG: protein kinase [Myxococcales bacterium]|nr:protein kinase [Myxococcales bacterium]